MYLHDIWASLVRRWILVLACLLATAGLGLVVAQKVPPTYESAADIVLVPPKSTVDPGANRYLSLIGLRQAVDVLTRSLGSDSTKDAIHEVAPEGEFEATADLTTSAPILTVTAKAGSPGSAQKLLDAALAQVPINLRQLQTSVQIGTKNQITPQLIAQDEQPKTVTKKQVRAVGAVVAISLLLSAMLVGAVDNRLLRRASAKQEKETNRRVVQEAQGRRADTEQQESDPVKREPDAVSAKIRR